MIICTEEVILPVLVSSDFLSNECIVDKIPEHGWIEWNSQFHRDKRIELHEAIPSISLVQYKCERNYHNFGVEENLCFDKKWIKKVPDCERFCLLSYAVPERDMKKTVCTRKGAKIPCMDRLQIGTQLVAVNERNESIKKVCHTDAQWNILSNLV